MVFFSDYFQHRQDCQRKQEERRARISHLPDIYTKPITEREREILAKPVQELVQDVQKHQADPVDVLRAYAKVALKAHEKTNCLTEIMFPQAEDWARNGVNLKGPLAGVPVSMKDTIAVAGFDSTVGYSCNTFKPFLHDGQHVRMLKQAGLVPFVKTNVPISLLSFESTNDVWGRTTNPHNKDYSAGGSTGGESALLAAGGSRIGIGTDVAGSVRVPAHFAGCYSLKCSPGRWPKMGMKTSMPGQDGIPSVYSPMSRELPDLVYFTRAFLSTQPWRLDHTVIPMEWREEHYKQVHEKKKLRFGVMRTDGVVDPAPACARALEETVQALKAEGHDVYDVKPPVDPLEALEVAALLVNSDGSHTFRSFYRTGEWDDPGAAQMVFYNKLPSPIRYLWYLYTKYVRGDHVWARLLRHFRPASAAEHWALIARREAHKVAWHAWWQGDDGHSRGGEEEDKVMDFLLTPPNATPAVPHDGMHDTVSSCGYTFLFNLLEYTAGVLPVTHVSATVDALPSSFSVAKLNGVARGAYKHYDAVRMAGLPVGVQVVGQRLQEEKVLAAMEVVEAALDKHNGGKYDLLAID